MTNNFFVVHFNKIPQFFKRFFIISFVSLFARVISEIAIDEFSFLIFYQFVSASTVISFYLIFSTHDSFLIELTIDFNPLVGSNILSGINTNPLNCRILGK